LFNALLESVRAEVSGERALDSVRSIARYHRVQSSPGYDEAADWLTARLEAYGIAVEREMVPGDGRTRLLGSLMPQGWECTHAVATLVDGVARRRLCDYEAEKLSLILRSAPARGRFPIVALEDDESASGAEVRGAVVLTRSAVHAALRRWVVEGGAAGLLYDGRRLVPPVRDAFDDPDALSYTSFWWNEEEKRGWGFVLSPRAGADLRERLRAGAKLELEVEIESRAFDTRIPLVSAVIPAAKRAASAGEILVVSHLCHPQPSANDNASGASANLEAARVLSALLRRGAWEPGPRSVRFLWVPEITGTAAWLAQEPRRAGRIAGMRAGRASTSVPGLRVSRRSGGHPRRLPLAN
jgi:aminopeptidase-like protein